MTRWEALRLWLEAQARHPDAADATKSALARMDELDATHNQDDPTPEEPPERPHQERLGAFA